MMELSLKALCFILGYFTLCSFHFSSASRGLENERCSSNGTVFTVLRMVNVSIGRCDAPRRRSAWIPEGKRRNAMKATMGSTSTSRRSHYFQAAALVGRNEASQI